MESLVCPICHAALDREIAALHCRGCGRAFPVEADIADFSEGRYYDHFTPGDAVAERHARGLQFEEAGTRARINDFYVPLLRRETNVHRVLDCGTGNGIAVDLLHERGFDAWGADLSALRKWQWRARRRRDRLVVADAMRLPFADGWLDAIIASGLIEHIGVEEQGGERYRVRPLPDRDERRVALLRELVRVVRPGGVLYLDFPNGAFPIDFWHGTIPGGARLHSPREGFLPTMGELRALAARAGATQLRALSPLRRLQFRQSGSHWYGRLLALPAAMLFRAMRWRPLAWLAATAINPFLVIRMQRRALC
jgi:SAM-dependent methyltransferase